MRKFALRGLIVLLIVLVGCFFFSGTVKTLTTAKVMFISPKQGKLKEQISLTGYLTFSATEGIRIASGNNGVSFPINRIYVTKGSYVKAGDILTELSHGVLYFLGVRTIEVPCGVAADGLTIAPQGIDQTPHFAAFEVKALLQHFAAHRSTFAPVRLTQILTESVLDLPVKGRFSFSHVQHPHSFECRRRIGTWQNRPPCTPEGVWHHRFSLSFASEAP